MDLSYNAGVPAALVAEVERQARKLGLPLAILELLGQDAKVARDFLRACRRGEGRAFVDGLDHVALERLLATRETGRRILLSPVAVFHAF